MKIAIYVLSWRRQTGDSTAEASLARCRTRDFAHEKWFVADVEAELASTFLWGLLGRKFQQV